MAISKLSKKILILFLVISCVITFAIYTIENPYIDSVEIQKCDLDSKSEFIANGRYIYIYIYGYEPFEIEKTKINIIKKTKYKYKEPKFNASYKNDNIFFTNGKISKSDTILIEINNKKIKLYDFTYEGEKINAGKYRGHYSCMLRYKENGISLHTSPSDTIYVTKN